MPPVIYHLIGTPAAGKYTIGKLVAEATGARFIDNHSIANVIFNVIGTDGVTPLPEGIWTPVGKVRAAVLETVVQLAPAHLSFVFTNYLRGEDPAEDRMFQQMVELAATRASVFIPVLLRCETSELKERAASESRVARMKLIDPLAIAQMNDDTPLFETSHPNVLKLDTTKRSPADSARLIVEWGASRRLESPA
ncbi:MAG: hypothetical protein ABI577_04315 [bacterium]